MLIKKLLKIIKMQTFISLDHGEAPPINKMCQFVRYGENKPVTGYLIDEHTVYISYTGTKESILNFKGFKVIHVTIWSL